MAQNGVQSLLSIRPWEYVLLSQRVGGLLRQQDETNRDTLLMGLEEETDSPPKALECEYNEKWP